MLLFSRWMTRLFVTCVVTLWCVADPAGAVTVTGGNGKFDCLSVFEAPGANKPAPPKTPKHVDCIDGDPACDGDGERNARCEFTLQVCVNSTLVPACTPDTTDSVAIDHAIDNGDPKFDPDFQAMQSRVDTLGFPGNDFADDCTAASTITVPLTAKSGNKFKKARKKLKLEALGTASGKDSRDKDRMNFTCRPEGDGVYLPTDLYDGTFDRIAQQIFLPSCAISACHDSESEAGGLNLLAGAAYSQLVDVPPSNAAAALAGLMRVDSVPPGGPGDPDNSFLYTKVLPDLLPGWGLPMPLVGASLNFEQLQLIELWIVGDGILGPAPATGWVTGTDQ
jgi:hypothetical protein